MIELLIEGNNGLIRPAVQSGIQWTTERRGAPSQLRFRMRMDSFAQISEGNAVRLRKNGQNVFFGFVFLIRRDKSEFAEITAYDQLRYLKNKDTYVFANRRASDVIRTIANDFRLNLGSVAQTSYVIPSQVEDNSSLFDVIYNALDKELKFRGNMFVLFDDFGRLTLQPLSAMELPLLIDSETGENYEYTTTINDGTANRIKLSRENEATGRRDIYMAQDSSNMNRWGVLQHFETINEADRGQDMAAGLLSLHNAPKRTLRLSRQFGDVRVRAGSLPIVHLDVGDVRVRSRLMVEKATHTFDGDSHFMDLQLRGGQFNG